MRKLRYSVAMSLDGYIAGPQGEFDWITIDPDINFAELYAQFDTAFIGRKTYQMMLEQGGAEASGFGNMQTFVFSTTRTKHDFPDVTLVAENAVQFVEQKKSEPGQDIWLFGGGELFASLSQHGLVETIETAIIPVVLGEGIAMCPQISESLKLELTGHRLFPRTGTLLAEYAIRK